MLLEVKFKDNFYIHDLKYIFHIHELFPFYIPDYDVHIPYVSYH